MQLRHLLHPFIVAALLPVAMVFAQTEGGSTESGWLKLVKGARDSVLGARVVNIEDDAATDTQKLTLAIPKKALGDRDDIEEIVVVGQRPEHPERGIPIKFSYEWVSDYDSDNYGLVVRLGKDSNWPIRLYLNSEPGFTR